MGIFFSHLWLCSPKSKNRQASEGGIRSVSHFQIEQICTVPQTNHRFAGFPGKHRQTFNNVILESLITLLEHEGCMDRLFKRETPEVTTELLRKKKRRRKKVTRKGVKTRRSHVLLVCSARQWLRLLLPCCFMPGHLLPLACSEH